MASSERAAAASLQHLIGSNRREIAEVLERYGASNPRLFGSAARGDATDVSDVDLLVDLDPAGSTLLRVAGLSEELTTLLGVRVDVVCEGLLRDRVARSAVHEAVSL